MHDVCISDEVSCIESICRVNNMIFVFPLSIIIVSRSDCCVVSSADSEITGSIALSNRNDFESLLGH